MHCVRSLLRKFACDTNGSAVVGFVLTAPLVVIAFLAIFQLAMLGSAYIGLTTSVSEGARQSAVIGESDHLAERRVIDLAAQHSLHVSENQVVIAHLKRNGLALVRVTAQTNKRISFLNRDIALHSSVEVIDEDAYR